MRLDKDNEKIIILYKGAKMLSEQTGRDFYDCFRTLREEMLSHEEKEEKAKQEAARTLTMAMEQGSDELYRICKEAWKIQKQMKIPYSDGDAILAFATRGKVKPKHTASLQQYYGDGTKEFYDKVNEVNSLARRNYYVWCKLADEDTMERVRARAITKYEELDEIGKSLHQRVDSTNRWSHDAATITIDEEIAKLNGPNFDYPIGFEFFGLPIVGAVPFDGIKVDFPTESYDTAYFVASLFLRDNTQGNFYNKTFFESAQKRVAKELETLKGMNVAAYRERRINQMQLSDEEKKSFDSYIAELTRSQQEQVQVSLGG